MKLPLPVCDFRFISYEEFSKDMNVICNNCNMGCNKHINMVNDCNDCYCSILKLQDGYLIEYDIKYFKELHDYDNDVPLAPDNIVIKKHYYLQYNKNVK